MDASSIPMSSQHELQRYGKRAAGLENKRVNKAVFINQIVQRQQEQAHMAQMQRHQQQHHQEMNVEPVQEEQNQEAEQQQHQLSEQPAEQ